jgi:hypothetical protein
MKSSYTARQPGKDVLHPARELVETDSRVGRLN